MHSDTAQPKKEHMKHSYQRGTAEMISNLNSVLMKALRLFVIILAECAHLSAMNTAESITFE